jgi:hypothetical protein
MGSDETDRGELDAMQGRQQTGQVFICYRRSDTQAITGRIAEWLAQRMPRQDLFIDVDLEYGIDFVRRIQETIPRCAAVLIIIGSRWLSDQDTPSSFVRMEVELALEHWPRVKIIPVVVDGAQMPAAEILPESIRPLANINAAEVRSGRDFQHDMELLAASLGLSSMPALGVIPTIPPASTASPIGTSVPRATPRPFPGRALFFSVIAVLGVSLIAALVFLHVPQRFIVGSPSPTPTATSSVTTPTATSSATTPQGLYQQITSAPPALSDPLTNQDTNSWDVTGGTSGTCRFGTGSYQVGIPATDRTQECFANATSFGNFALQVKITILAGDAGGIVFRALSATGTRLRWGVYADGHYDVAFATGQFQNSLIAKGNSPYLNSGNGQSNVLTIIARGSAVYLYANGQVVTTLNMPPDAPAAGEIGVFAYDLSNPTEVAFSDLRVWTL